MSFSWTTAPDATEDYDVTTEETPPGQVELGEGAIHVYVPGEPAQVETRTGKVSGKSVQETVKEGSDNVYLKYNANTNGEKVIALTFDDGPWAHDERAARRAEGERRRGDVLYHW